MTNQESAFEQISILVKDFKENETKYLSPDYGEADVRTDFINKFLNALGWDVYHNEQKNPYEQEVKIEKGVPIGRIQKRADYAFYIAPNFRDVKFYLEAKKPSRNLYNADDYFQSCRYGWNSQTEITFLFDFEELHILDCRTKPDISTILENKIKVYKYSEYTNQEKFSEIYWLISREAVANNSLEKFANSLPKPKGKAVQKGLFKGGYQSIDEAFLIELDEIRDALAKSFKKANPHLNSEQLTEMTQRTIDRLVFIRFLEDKLIEPEHYVSEFGDSKNAWKDFRIACRKLDAKYNGIVFKKHFIDSDNFIEPDDKTFTQICEELAHVNSPYNFDIIPIHILGSIYERFLGKVVIATEKRVRIEEKPEVRKAGGVYYTPQYIVNYIVDNTVGKLIEGKTPNEIAKLRFADISCGSGSFLITVFDRLLEYHRKWYQDNPAQAKKDGCYFQDGKWILSIKQKQKILTNNIYGVDLDSQAVEVTQVSLYLKLLEDETTATAQDTWVMFKEQILPNLNNNIICGNSLIGTDILDGELFNSEDELKLKPMNFEEVFPEVMKKGGFDAIVGNPPWIDIKGLNPTEVEYYFKKFSTTENRMNIYATFIDKAMSLLNSRGKLGYIIPNSILFQSSYKKLRDKILSNYFLYNVIKMPDNTFKYVKAESVIIIMGKEKRKDCKCLIFGRDSELNSIDENEAIEKKILVQSDWLNHELLIFDIFSNKSILNLLAKIEKLKLNLGNICDFTLGITPYDKYKGHSKKQIEDRVFHSTTQKNSTFKKLLAGGDVARYSVSWSGGEYISYGKWLGAPREKRFFTNKRILIRQIVSGNPLRIFAGYTEEELYNTQTIFNLVLKEENTIELKFILGILNSSLMNFYHSYKYLDLTKNLFQKILIQNCKMFPIPQIDLSDEYQKSNYLKIISLVEQMLESKKQLMNVKTDSEKEYLEMKCNSLDRQIDNLVYELYGLTEEEIKIVEDSLKNKN